MTDQDAIDGVLAFARKHRIDRGVAEDAVWYYLDEGYPPEQAEIFAIDELESEDLAWPHKYSMGGVLSGYRKGVVGWIGKKGWVGLVMRTFLIIGIRGWIFLIFEKCLGIGCLR